jgi:hypothetical protein
MNPFNALTIFLFEIVVSNDVVFPCCTQTSVLDEEYERDFDENGECGAGPG